LPLSKAFLQYLDRCGVDRAALINYVARKSSASPTKSTSLSPDYCRHAPKRLISCGSLHPRHTTNIMADVEHILRLGIRMIKIHPPHQLLFPNDYLNGVNELEIIYRAARPTESQSCSTPVLRSSAPAQVRRPIYLDDVAVDFPN